MKKLILSIITAISLNALVISGVGYGESESESKKEAVSDLSNQISVEVKSEFKTITKTFGKDAFSKTNESFITLSSNLPIKGVQYKLQDQKNYIDFTNDTYCIPLPKADLK